MSAIFVLDSKGKCLISRDYRGDIPLSVRSKFVSLLTQSDDADLPPIIYDEDLEITFLHVKENNIILLSLTNRNANAIMMISFLRQLVSLFNHYFGVLTIESVRTNFEVVYELLDEVIDFGIPQLTDPHILKLYIKQKGTKIALRGNSRLEVETNMSSVSTSQHSKALSIATGRVPWRPPGLKYRKNELFFNIVEKANLLVSSTGDIIHSEIEGLISMKTQLSGMPVVQIALNDKSLLNATSRNGKSSSAGIEGVKFHNSVSLDEFEAKRIVSFTPPDGEFELMQYRITTTSLLKPLFWIEPTVVKQGHSRIDYLIRVRSNFPNSSMANNVTILIPVPSDASNPKFKYTRGKAEYKPEHGCILWEFKRFAGHCEYTLKATVGLASVATTPEEETSRVKDPIRMTFEIPLYTMSGLKVRRISVHCKENYRAQPFLTSRTCSGSSYEFRMPIQSW